MGKRKFIDKKAAVSFRLVQGAGRSEQPPVEDDVSGWTAPASISKEQLEEQHKYGVFFDDDYNYLQHLRSANEVAKLEPVERTFLPAPKSSSFGHPPAPSNATQVGVPDSDVAAALENQIEGDGELEDDFVAMAGGALPENAFTNFRGSRAARIHDDDSDDNDEEDDSDMTDDEFAEDDYDDEEAGDGEGDGTAEPRTQRELDDAYKQLVNAEYSDQQVGELDLEADEIGGQLEPDAPRVRRLFGDKRADPQYDEQFSRAYVRERMRLIEEGAIDPDADEQLVDCDVDFQAAKRAKWDAETFVTTYSNIYNRPNLIDGNTKRRPKLGKVLEKLEDQEEESEEEEAMSVDTTTSTFRPRGETPAERKVRKAAVREARAERRQQKKANKLAFKEIKKEIDRQASVPQLRTRHIV